MIDLCEVNIITIHNIHNIKFVKFIISINCISFIMFLYSSIKQQVFFKHLWVRTTYLVIIIMFQTIICGLMDDFFFRKK